MTSEEKTILSQSGLFNEILPGEVEGLLHCLRAEECHYEKGDVVLSMGQEVNGCLLILSGAVRAESVNADGTHVLMAYHGPGALVGDVLMATPDSTSPVYVLAAERTALLRIPYRRIMEGCQQCCTRHSRLRENLLSEIAVKFWAQRRRTAWLSVRSLRGRIAMYLLDQKGDCFTLGGTREDLADLLCVNRSALSRELSRMAQEGLIEFKKDTFWIIDRQGLRHCI